MHGAREPKRHTDRFVVWLSGVGGLGLRELFYAVVSSHHFVKLRIARRTYELLLNIILLPQEEE